MTTPVRAGRPFAQLSNGAALEAITERFAGRGADPGRVNGSALNQIRTNEVALAFPWERREFTLSDSGALQPDTVKLTPDSSLMGDPIIADFVNQNESAILIERHDVPETFAGAPFLAGSSINNLGPWLAPGIPSIPPCVASTISIAARPTWRRCSASAAAACSGEARTSSRRASAACIEGARGARGARRPRPY